MGAPVRVSIEQEMTFPSQCAREKGPDPRLLLDQSHDAAEPVWVEALLLLGKTCPAEVKGYPMCCPLLRQTPQEGLNVNVPAASPEL